MHATSCLVVGGGMLKRSSALATHVLYATSCLVVGGVGGGVVTVVCTCDTRACYSMCCVGWGGKCFGENRSHVAQAHASLTEEKKTPKSV